MPGYLRSWDSTCTALLPISYHPNHWFTKALQCPWMQNLWTWLFIFYVVKWARHEWLAYRLTCHSYTMWPHFSYSRMWSHTHGQSIFLFYGRGGAVGVTQTRMPSMSVASAGRDRKRLEVPSRWRLGHDVLQGVLLAVHWTHKAFNVWTNNQRHLVTKKMCCLILP